MCRTLKEIAMSVFLCFTLSSCAIDKMAHFTSSFTISTVSGVYYDKNTDWEGGSLKLASFLTAMTAGFMKEWMDKTFDWNDIAFDALGAGCAELR
jgi:hypothetical protein